MTRAEIIEYLYDNNVRADITIEQMAEDLADRKTEPITHDDYIESENDYLEAKYLNCANSGSYKCSKCDGEMYFKDEPQTEREGE